MHLTSAEVWSCLRLYTASFKADNSPARLTLPIPRLLALQTCNSTLLPKLSSPLVFNQKVSFEDRFNDEVIFAVAAFEQRFLQNRQLRLINANEATFAFCGRTFLPYLQIAVEKNLLTKSPPNIYPPDFVLILLTSTSLAEYCLLVEFCSSFISCNAAKETWICSWKIISGLLILRNGRDILAIL